MKYKQIQIEKFQTDLNNLDIKVKELNKPNVINDNEILVNMKLMSINPSDINAIMGLYKGFRPKSFPAIPGVN